MTREGSRRRSRARRSTASLNQPPWRNLRNPYRPLEVLSEGRVVVFNLFQRRANGSGDIDTCSFGGRSGFLRLVPESNGLGQFVSEKLHLSLEFVHPANVIM